MPTPPETTHFKIGDTVETIKGARFWGRIIAFDNDEASPGCTVLAIAPGFEGTKHVYPLKQLRHRAEDEDGEWEVVNFNGKRWRIIGRGGLWSMQPEGMISAEEAKEICLRAAFRRPVIEASHG